jgi:uncharacterized protein (DUF427 family)
MKGTRLAAVSPLQQIVTTELKKRFLGHSIRCMSDVNVARKWARSIRVLSDPINKYLLSFLYGFFIVSVRELVTLCTSKLEASYYLRPPDISVKKLRVREYITHRSVWGRAKRYS